MVDDGSQGQQRPAEQTAEQPVVPASPAGYREAEPVTSEFEANVEPAFDPHPEYAVGGAFIGGLLIGRLLRRLGK